MISSDFSRPAAGGVFPLSGANSGSSTLLRTPNPGSHHRAASRHFLVRTARQSVRSFFLQHSELRHPSRINLMPVNGLKNLPGRLCGARLVDYRLPHPQRLLIQLCECERCLPPRLPFAVSQSTVWRCMTRNFVRDFRPFAFQTDRGIPKFPSVSRCVSGDSGKVGAWRSQPDRRDPSRGLVAA